MILNIFLDLLRHGLMEYASYHLILEVIVNNILGMIKRSPGFQRNIQYFHHNVKNIKRVLR